jgi:hypothetical protein
MFEPDLETENDDGGELSQTLSPAENEPTGEQGKGKEERFPNPLDVDLPALIRYPHRPSVRTEGPSAQGDTDEQVVNALFKRATGFLYDVVDLRSGYEYQKYEPADVAACIFWLRCRRPSEWRDKGVVQVTGADGGAIKIQLLDNLEKKLNGLAGQDDQ